MRRIAVYIATTDGPVRIERITREAMPQSMVCLGRSSTVLPISSAYDDFVRPGSGPVARMFGVGEEGGFRLDVSDRIDSGASWQFAVFVAHAIVTADDVVLAGSDDEADEIAWFSGSVDYDGNLGDVGHVAEKLEASGAAFETWRRRGLFVRLFLHAPGDAARARSGSLPDGVVVSGVASALEGCEVLGLEVAAQGRAETVEPLSEETAATLVVETVKRRGPGRRMVLVLLLLLVVAGAALATISSKDRLLAWFAVAKAPEFVEPATEPKAEPSPKSLPLAKAAPTKAAPATILPAPPAGPKLTVWERRAPKGFSCAAVQFGDVQATLSKVPVQRIGQLADSDGKGLCGLTFKVETNDWRGRVTLELEVYSGRYIPVGRMPAVLFGEGELTRPTAWSIDLPARLNVAFEYRLVLTFTIYSGESNSLVSLHRVRAL